MVDYLIEITEGQIGAGDDPIGFLIASYAEFARRARSLALVYPKGWRPIEEAPRDGTRVLLGMDAGFMGGGRMIGSWGKGGWLNDELHPFIVFEPTHWMPPPAAPNPTLEGDGS